jgi:hypothetical protein
MSIGHLGWCGWPVSGHPAVANEEEQQDEGDCRNARPCGMPAGEPTSPNCFRLPSLDLAPRRKREGNDLPAGRANGQMSECLLLLMYGQRVLDEGVELVRVWMLSGLEKFAHS